MADQSSTMTGYRPDPSGTREPEPRLFLARDFPFAFRVSGHEFEDDGAEYVITRTRAGRVVMTKRC